jgi:hypothetical protein
MRVAYLDIDPSGGVGLHSNKEIDIESEAVYILRMSALTGHVMQAPVARRKNKLLSLSHDCHASDTA